MQRSPIDDVGAAPLDLTPVWHCSKCGAECNATGIVCVSFYETHTRCCSVDAHTGTLSSCCRIACQALGDTW